MFNIKISMQTLPSQPKIERVEGMVALWFLIKHSLFCCLFFFFLIRSWRKGGKEGYLWFQESNKKGKSVKKIYIFFSYLILL